MRDEKEMNTDRAEIDAQLAEMATDRVYQEEAVRIAEELAKADWETLQIADGSQGVSKVAASLPQGFQSWDN